MDVPTSGHGPGRTELVLLILSERVGSVVTGIEVEDVLVCVGVGEDTDPGHGVGHAVRDGRVDVIIRRISGQGLVTGRVEDPGRVLRIDRVARIVGAELVEMVSLVFCVPAGIPVAGTVVQHAGGLLGEVGIDHVLAPGVGVVQLVTDQFADTLVITSAIQAAGRDDVVSGDISIRVGVDILDVVTPQHRHGKGGRTVGLGLVGRGVTVSQTCRPAEILGDVPLERGLEGVTLVLDRVVVDIPLVQGAVFSVDVVVGLSVGERTVVTTGKVHVCHFLIPVEETDFPLVESEGTVLQVRGDRTVGVVGLVEGGGPAAEEVVLRVLDVALHVEGKEDVGTDVHVHVGAGGDTVQSGADFRARLFVVGEGSVVTGRLAAAGHTDRVALLDDGLVVLLDPVVVEGLHRGNLVLEGLEVAVFPVGLEGAFVTDGLHGAVGPERQAAVVHLTGDVHALEGVHRVEVSILGRGHDSRRTLVGDDGLGTFLTALGRDNDNTVRGPGSVDGGRGGVLQDVDRLDIVRVQTRDGVTDEVDVVEGVDLGGVELDRVLVGDTVDNPQRLTASHERAGTTDTDLGGRTRGHGRGRDLQTGDLTFQHLVDAQGTDALEFAAVDRGHGGSQQTAVDGGVTGDDRFGQAVLVQAHLHVEGLLAVESPFFRRHTDHGELKDFTSGGFDPVLTVKVGGDTSLGALDNDGNTGKRLTVGIRHHT